MTISFQILTSNTFVFTDLTKSITGAITVPSASCVPDTVQSMSCASRIIIRLTLGGSEVHAAQESNGKAELWTRQTDSTGSGRIWQGHRLHSQAGRGHRPENKRLIHVLSLRRSHKEMMVSPEPDRAPGLVATRLGTEPTGNSTPETTLRMLTSHPGVCVHWGKACILHPGRTAPWELASCADSRPEDVKGCQSPHAGLQKAHLLKSFLISFLLAFWQVSSLLAVRYPSNHKYIHFKRLRNKAAYHKWTFYSEILLPLFVN